MTACPLMLLMLAAAGFPLCLANGIVYPAAGDSLVAVQHHNVTWFPVDVLTAVAIVNQTVFEQASSSATNASNSSTMDAATNSTTANFTASFDVVRCNAGVPTYPFHATREEWTCSEIYLTTTNATADDKIVLATNFDLSQGRVLVTVPSVMPGDDYVVHLAASPNGINYTDFASDAFNITLRSD